MDADASQRRFRAELEQIPTVTHEVYGTCLAPTYPSQLPIALGQLASLPIGAWRGQASVDWASTRRWSAATGSTARAGRARR